MHYSVPLMKLFCVQKKHCSGGKGPQQFFPDCRTAQFLNLLAQVDVMCGNLNDCQVKLQGIEFLLQLGSRFQPYDIACKKQEMAADSEVLSTLKHLTLDRVSNKYVIDT